MSTDSPTNKQLHPALHSISLHDSSYQNKEPLSPPDLSIFSQDNGSPTSPSSEPSSSTGLDGQALIKRERRKRRVKPVDAQVLDMKCGVCGDRAHGYNFNAVTCESCKAFFRRNALRGDTQVIKCNFDSNCKLDAHTRRFCTECRLRKCFSIGMKKDWILKDDQLVKRRERSRIKKELAKLSLAQCGALSPSSLTLPPLDTSDAGNPAFILPGTDSLESCKAEASPSSCESSYETSACSPTDIPIKQEPISPELPSSSDSKYAFDVEDDQICDRLRSIEQALADTVDTPYSEQQVAKFTPSSTPGMFNMADTFIRRFIKFCKCLPEFAELSQQDQIALLKGGIMEVMILRGALKFDARSLAFHFKQQSAQMGDFEFSKDGLIPAELVAQLSTPACKSEPEPEPEPDPDPDPNHSSDSQEEKKGIASESHTNAIHFFMQLNELVESQKTPVLILMLIELFSPDRPNLVAKENVARIQEYYSHVLQIFLKRYMPEQLENGLYPKLLMKLVDVRELGEASSKSASSLDSGAFEPLLVEVFSLK